MAFAINFLREAIPEGWLAPSDTGVLGEITIGNFNERFVINTNYWSENDYVSQWIQGISRLTDEEREESSSLLITQIYNSPDSRYAAMCWGLYKENEKVYIQNYFVPAKGLRYPISPDELYSKNTIRRKGVSEWVSSVSELKEWLSKLERSREARD